MEQPVRQILPAQLLLNHYQYWNNRQRTSHHLSTGKNSWTQAFLQALDILDNRLAVYRPFFVELHRPFDTAYIRTHKLAFLFTYYITERAG